MDRGTGGRDEGAVAKSIFLDAVEIASEPERLAYLDRRCGSDHNLRSEVETLLRHQRQLGDYLERPAVDLEATRDLSPRPITEGPGTVIGPYKLVEELGAGGMGDVWMAEQTHPVRRKVALKIIKPGMDTRQVVTRFEAERQALALMDHPNIARVFDGGETDSGRPYFVMELVDGASITAHCDDHELPLRQRLGLFLAVCHAVQHAHQKGIIHRDLKPSNVLVALLDGEPVPKVIDFGVAKATAPELAERTTLTRDGQIIGTLEYMSPEQASFNGSDIDTRGDIYSLGVLLYELLTGSTPVRIERLSETSLEEVLRIIREEQPPRPSTRLSEAGSLPSLAARRQLEPARLKKLVRGELDWIVMKCLEKDRSRRYETVSGLARDVERYLANQTVEASPRSTSYRLKKLLRRHRGPVLAVSIIFLLLIGGIVGTTLGLVQARAARRSAALRAWSERQAKETAERRLDQIQKGIAILGSIFEDLDPTAEEKEGRPLRAILGNRLERAAEELDGEAIGDPLVTAELQDRLGRTCAALGHATTAKSLFTRAVATRGDRLGAAHPDTLATKSRLARALLMAGELNQAIVLAERVRDAQTRGLGIAHRDTLLTTNILADAYRQADRGLDGIALLEQARDVQARTLGPDDPQTVATLENLSLLYGDYKRSEAITIAVQVRNARVRAHGRDHPLAIRALYNLASRYQSLGKMKRALALFEEARDVSVPKLGEDDSTTLAILANLTLTYRAFQRTDEAIALGEHVRAIHVRNLGAYHPRTIRVLDFLALAYMDARKTEKALPLLQQAAAGLEKYQFRLDESGRIISDFCTCLDRSNRSRDADEWRGKWLAAAKARHGPDSGFYAAELEIQGTGLLDRERCADAEPLVRECLAIRQRSEPEDWQTFLSQSSLGVALMGQQKYAEAEPLLLSGYEGLKAREQQIPQFFVGHHLATASSRIIRLYEVWDQPEKAAKWRSKLKEAGAGQPAPVHPNLKY
jgi:serine/threonine protein kinase/tetratricopeptide (TPR) repeat protein